MFSTILILNGSVNGKSINSIDYKKCLENDNSFIMLIIRPLIGLILDGYRKEVSVFDIPVYTYKAFFR
jgi:hypothetical protein